MNPNIKKTRAALAAALLSTALLGAPAAYAGPGTAAAVALGTAEVCGPATVATGPWGLLCFAGGGLLSVISIFAPSP